MERLYGGNEALQGYVDADWDLRRSCCGPKSAVDGCGTIHWRKAGIGARLRGAPTRATAGWDLPGALRRHWGRPVVQPRVRGGRFCRFCRTSIWVAPVGLLVFGSSRFRLSRWNGVSDNTLTGRRRAESSLVEAAPSALYSPRRLLHVDGDF